MRQVALLEIASLISLALLPLRIVERQPFVDSILDNTVRKATLIRFLICLVIGARHLNKSPDQRFSTKIHRYRWVPEKYGEQPNSDLYAC